MKVISLRNYCRELKMAEWGKKNKKKTKECIKVMSLRNYCRVQKTLRKPNALKTENLSELNSL